MRLTPCDGCSDERPRGRAPGGELSDDRSRDVEIAIAALQEERAEHAKVLERLAEAEALLDRAEREIRERDDNEWPALDAYNARYRQEEAE